MNGERWKQLRALFEHVVMLPHSERSAFIDSECEAQDIDAALREELMALLAADAASSVGAGPIAELAPDLLKELQADSAASEHQLPPGSRFGPWEVRRELGRGGEHARDSVGHLLSYLSCISVPAGFVQRPCAATVPLCTNKKPPA